VYTINYHRRLTDEIEAEEDGQQPLGSAASAAPPTADVTAATSTSVGGGTPSTADTAVKQEDAKQQKPSPWAGLSLSDKTSRRVEMVKQLRRLQEEWMAGTGSGAGGSAGSGAGSKAGKGGGGAGGGARRGFVAPLAAVGEVAESDIARVISDWTGIPLTKLVETEVDKVRAVVSLFILA
jgi:ATP-dependent Clp protease ATP-binding subunit ClpA